MRPGRVSPGLNSFAEPHPASSRVSRVADTVEGVNRTDRPYALVEELRVIAPRPRSATWLAERFEISSRTVERDVGALQQSGVPIWAEPGRTGGHRLDPIRSLPPARTTSRQVTATSSTKIVNTA